MQMVSGALEGLGFKGLGCVNSARAVGAPFTLGIEAHPLIARLC